MVANIWAEAAQIEETVCTFVNIVTETSQLNVNSYTQLAPVTVDPENVYAHLLPFITCESPPQDRL